MKKYTLIFILQFFCVLHLLAQTEIGTTAKTASQANKVATTKNVDWFLYAGVGALAYKGDLADSYQKWSGLFHIGVQKYRKRWLNPRFEVFYGTLTGQNSAYTFENGNPNKFFQTTLLGGTMNLHLNILKHDYFTIYVSQGLGISYFWIHDKDGNNFDKLNNTRALGEVYSPTTLLLPTSLGGTFFFQNKFGLGVEAGLQNFMTDYLDNIGKWGQDSGNDSALRLKFSFYAPVVWALPVSKKKIPTKK